MKTTLIAAVIGWLALTWPIANFLKLKTADAWVLRGGLAAVGIAGAAAWVRMRPQHTAKTVPPAAAAKNAASELDALIREAAEKLAGSTLRSGLGDLPLFYVLGDRGSAKTSAVLHSGLEAELLAGQVYEGEAVTPTRTANMWITGRTVFAEIGGAMLGDAAACQHLIAKLQPRRAMAILMGKRQAPRAVLMCVDTEIFLGSAATKAAESAARLLHERVTAISTMLGVQLPVYVLFTRADRVPYFTQFVRNLTHEEAAEPFGAALGPPPRSGVYAQDQSTRIAAAFESLFHRAAAARPDHLSREQNASVLPDVYEFPREFRKLQSVITQFLVDVCRPPQLSAGPFLRGFYFSGVRPVIVEEALRGSGKSSNAALSPLNVGATSIFNPAVYLMPATAAPQPAFGGSKVPQWLFLTSFFHNVLLSDRTAVEAGSYSFKTRLAQRILLTCAAASAVLFAVALTVSFFGNRDLQRAATHAVGRTQAATSLSSGAPSLGALQALDLLRRQIIKLTGYERNGHPASLGWGLYHGDSLLPHVRRAYFDNFHRLLLAGTQTQLVANLAALPAAPGADQAYDQTAYDKLRTYLITTSNHDKSTRDFIQPRLTEWWAQVHPVDVERKRLAAEQFGFYADELRSVNPYSSTRDQAAVQHARKYLNAFAAEEKLYASALGVPASPLNFNKIYPGSAAIVVNKYDVPGAFTAAAWPEVHQRLKKSPQGEEWVLGEGAQAAAGDAAGILTSIRARYRDAYIRHWRAYLRAGSFTGYGSLRDAAQKLARVSSTQSEVLAMIALASRNTTIGEAEIAGAFRAAHTVVPPPAAEIVAANNKPYLTALQNLQIALDQAVAAGAAPPPAAVQQALMQAAAARAQVGQLVLSFGADPETPAVQKLLTDPIAAAERELKKLGPVEVNQKGKALCDQFRGVYPLYPEGKDLPLTELRKLLQKPDGLLWKLYAELQPNLAFEGGKYVTSASSAISFTPKFLTFFNKAARASEMLYGTGTQEPKLEYSVRFVRTGSTVDRVTLVANGKRLELSESSPAVSLVWPGSEPYDFEAGATGVQLMHKGPWSLFRFIDEREKWSGTDTRGTGDWPGFAGASQRRTGTLRFELSGPAVALKSALSFGCVAEIAR